MKRQWNNDRNESRLQSFLAVTKYRGGVHGFFHSQRVERFGLMLAEKTDADRDVIIWFAYLHDSQRTNDGYDNNHGPEAARFVDTIRNAFLQELSDTQISKLKEACRLHTSTHRTGDITIDTCFDADRLDLPRVGIMPDPKRMATEQGAMYADRGDYDNCERYNGYSKTTGLLFHDRIIKTGKGESKFAVRYNSKTDDGKSIGPFTYSRGKFSFKEWNLSAKSVSESDCILFHYTSDGTGIFAVEYDKFISGKGYAVEHMVKYKDITLILLEYTEDDVISRNESEICLRQCNIVFVSDQPTFMTKWKDGTINELMKQFITEKEAAEYNTYAKPIRDINIGVSKLMRDLHIVKNFDFAYSNASVLNLVENLSMPRSVIIWGVLIKINALDSKLIFTSFFNIARFKYMNQLYDEEIEMLKSIFDDVTNKDELMKARLKAFNDADILNKYLFTGKNEYERLFYKTSKMMFDKIVVPIRKEAEEQAKSLMKLFQ
ncbi:MAG: hypothetical protein J6A02_00610 [Prevotella sp.]|nr:hypothetical protein [Prevotella sp.]